MNETQATVESLYSLVMLTKRYIAIGLLSRKPRHRKNSTLQSRLMKYSVFWIVSPCSPLQANRYFGEARCLHLQDRKISQARNQHEAVGKQSRASHLLHVYILLRLFFDPEDGGDLFLRNVNWLSEDLRSLFSGRQDTP
jgi:hypothetical protein